MGWRVRKRVSFGKLLRLNLSNSGVSLGIGPPGFNLNIGRRGVRTTVGLPGSGLSYQTFKSWDHDARSSKRQSAVDWQARADAMVAGWRRQYVGNVYEGDAGGGATERIVITDVRLGHEGPVVSVAFNPRKVDGKLVYDTPHDYSMANFAKFASWSQVESQGKPVSDQSSSQNPTSSNPLPEPITPSSSPRLPRRFLVPLVAIGAILVCAWLMTGNSQRPSSTASSIQPEPALPIATAASPGADAFPGPGSVSPSLH